MHFTYSNPTKILFGKNQISSIAPELSKDAKVLVIYGGGSIKKNGVYQQVATALEGFDWLEFSGVEPNPTKETLDKAVTLIKQENVNFIVAVGGGSVIDGSKYVAAAAKYEGDGWDILTGKHQVQDALPLGAVLTLPATGSESNMGAVITKAETQEKLAFLHPSVQPKFAVLDPEVMKSLPDRQLINGVLDAWVHVCEQYITQPQGAMVQDGYAEALLRTLKHLAMTYEQRDSDEWRANLMWSANQALNGLIGSGVSQDWATHMLGHELTAFWGVDHARSLAIVQPWLLRNQIELKRSKLEQLGTNVFHLPTGKDLAEHTIDELVKLYQQLGAETQFDGYDGDKSQAVERIIQQLQSHGMTALGEQGQITLDDSRKILMDALV